MSLFPTICINSCDSYALSSLTNYKEGRRLETIMSLSRTAFCAVNASVDGNRLSVKILSGEYLPARLERKRKIGRRVCIISYGACNKCYIEVRAVHLCS